jgi:isocitrate/isopropylmalate dehydrogenase
MKIAILPGDGIGPEIVDEAVRVLNALDEKFEMETAPVGGAGYEAHGHPLPDGTLKLAKEADAILFGAVGDWKYDKLERALRPEQAILGLRKHLQLFANFRPAICYPELTGASSLKPELVANLDILIVRELNGDIYFGQPRGMREAPDGPFKGAREGLIPCAIRNRKSAASRTSPSRPPPSAASACAAWTRPTCWKPSSSGKTSSPKSARSTRTSSCRTCTWTTPPCSW